MYKEALNLCPQPGIHIVLEDCITSEAASCSWLFVEPLAICTAHMPMTPIGAVHGQLK